MTSREAPRLVTVVVPVLDGARVLGGQLEALAAQDHEGEFEVVIADNGSADGTRNLAERWAAAGPRRRVVDASQRRGSSAARNCGAAAGTGDFLAFCDADNVASRSWLRELTAAASADIVAGRGSVAELNGALHRAWYGGPPSDRPLRAMGFLAFASSGNLGIWRDRFEQLGGFDEGLLTGEDIDLSWRAQLGGMTLRFAPDAVMHRRYRTELRDLAVQHYRYGKGYVDLYHRYRGQGVGRRPARVVVGDWGWIALHAWRAARDERERGIWVRRTALRCGLLAGSVRRGVAYP